MQVEAIISYTILFIALLKALTLGTKYRFKAQDYLFIYLLITFITDFGSRLRIWLLNDASSNGMFYKIYIVFCVTFFAIYYYNKLSAKYLRILITIIGISVIICIFFTTSFTDNKFQPVTGILISIFYILTTIIWFSFIIRFGKEENILQNPVFWISTALLLWAMFFLFRISATPFFDKTDKYFLSILKTINYVTSCIMYLLIFIALTKYEKISKLALEDE